MNGNFRYTLTDEQRNTIKRKVVGKNVKGLASRADVCAILQKALDDAIKGIAPKPEKTEPVTIDADDYSKQDVEDLVKQNQLLQTRINVLQHRLDTEISK